MAFLVRRVSPLPLLLLLLLILVPAHAAPGAEAPKVSAIYAFGDSSVDVGNNNYLQGAAVAKSNFPPYGVDFPGSIPTGRFSNGYNGMDFMAIHMGFERSPPAFLSLSDKSNNQTLRGDKGVNFASAGSGILDSTGNSITLSKQIQYFSEIRSNMITQTDAKTTNSFLSKSIFVISIGANDMAVYFSKKSSANNTDKKKIISTLVSNYQNHIKRLYKLGARKFGMIDIAPIGCSPYLRSLNPTGGCVDAVNEFALEFNIAVKSMMQKVSSTLKGMKYSIGSSHEFFSSILKDPSALGFKEVKSACCGSGKFGESGCVPNAKYCSDRDHYLFWDKKHVTHAATKLASIAVYNGSLQFASPINFKQLIEDTN